MRRKNAKNTKSFNQQIKELDEELQEIQFSILQKGEYRDVKLPLLLSLS